MEHKVIPLPIEKNYRTILDIFDFAPPFSKLRTREKDVFSKLLEYNEKYSNLDSREKSKLIFDSDTYDDIAKDLGCSADVVKNVLSELRSKTIIIKDSNNHEVINPAYLLPKVDILSFKFTK